jgi:hypothetical protein
MNKLTYFYITALKRKNAKRMSKNVLLNFFVI